MAATSYRHQKLDKTSDKSDVQNKTLEDELDKLIREWASPTGLGLVHR